MVKLKCGNSECGKEWDYSGKNTIHATCPDCKKIVKIKSNQDEVKEADDLLW